MSKSSQTNDSQSELDYWQLFRDLPEPYMLFEASSPYTIVEVNKAREQLVGMSRQDSVGRPLFDIFPDISKRFRNTGVNELRGYITQAIRTGKPKQLRRFRYDLPGADGQPQLHYWESTYLPLKLGGKQISHVLAVTKDVTAAQATESRMVKAEGRLEAALAVGKVGGWAWDISTDIVVADMNLAKMLHMDTKQTMSGLPLAQFLAVIYPEDRPRIEQAIANSLSQRINFEEEFRIVVGLGKLHWLFARGTVSDRGGVTLFTGAVVDTTERRDLQAQVELARQQDHLNRQAATILQDRNDELEGIARTKDEFVALASHQLRTPATAVKQYVGMVLQGYAGDITSLQTDMLEKAFESNERQIKIINQILNAARADTGRLIMSPVPVNLTSLVRGIADEMRPALEQRQHTFTVRLPRTPVPVVADLSYMRMAVENLVHNASIYTPEGGTIGLRLDVIGKNARLRIQDTGVGIRQSDMNKLFVKFSRIHNPLSVAAGGSGIGLYLTAEILRLHGGSVGVISKLHQGTTFAILLPLVP